MTALQFAIGAANDATDALADRGRREKPVAAGLVGWQPAAVLAACLAGLGALVASLSGPTTVTIALAGLVCGMAYDLRLKRTAFAWLPFALGIPLLVAYALVGATGTITPPMLVMLPAGALAGSSLALGNALVDPEADRAASTLTPVVLLGPVRARRLAVALLVATVGLAVGSAAAFGATRASIVAGLLAGLLALAGLGMTVADARERRERGWEAQAVGVALLGVAWVAGLPTLGR